MIVQVLAFPWLYYAWIIMPSGRGCIVRDWEIAVPVLSLLLLFAPGFLYLKRRHIRTRIHFLHVLLAVALGVLVTLPIHYVWYNLIYWGNPHSMNEVKQNLHAIQLAVERYAKDNPSGYYPDYLLGGYWKDDYAISAEGHDRMLEYTHEVESQDAALQRQIVYATSGPGDILMTCGYMPEYPCNPYFLIRRQVRQTIPSSAPGPFRQVGFDIDRHMIQVSSDHRFEGCRIGERYWEWESEEPIARTLAGHFIYKGLIPPGEQHPRGYILIAFGNPDSEGTDYLTTVPGGHELDGRLPDGSGIGMGVPVIPELGLEPDGKPDGVIIVLSGGWPWDGE